MAQEVEFGRGGSGKIRSFWVGFGLTIITLGIYAPCWYYFVNDELKDIGIAEDDQNLGQSSPMASVAAILLGGWLIVPWLLSVYNYGQRIKRAQRLTGIPQGHQINPTLALLMIARGAILIVPYFLHYWYVTKHQNMALRAAAGLPYDGSLPVATTPTFGSLPPSPPAAGPEVPASAPPGGEAATTPSAEPEAPIAPPAPVPEAPPGTPLGPAPPSAPETPTPPHGDPLGGEAAPAPDERDEDESPRGPFGPSGM